MMILSAVLAKSALGILRRNVAKPSKRKTRQDFSSILTHLHRIRNSVSEFRLDTTPAGYKKTTWFS